MTAVLCNSMFPLSQQRQPWSPKEKRMVSDMVPGMNLRLTSSLPTGILLSHFASVTQQLPDTQSQLLP